MDRDSHRRLIYLCIGGHDYGMVTQAYADCLIIEYHQWEQRRLWRPETPSAASSSSRGSGTGHRRRPGHAEAGTAPRVRQSAMYSDRPRRYRGNRGRAQPPTCLPVEEHAGEVSSNELGPTIADTSRFETLSLNDSPPTLDSTDEAVVHAGDTVSGLPDSTVMVPSAAEEALSPRSEERRKFEEYLNEHTLETYDDLCKFLSGKSVVRAGAEVAEGEAMSQQSSPDEYLCSTESAVRAGAEVAESEAMFQQSSPDGYEARLVTAPEQAPPAAAQGQSKASEEEIACNGKKWMGEEAMVAFKKYIKGKKFLKDLDHEFDELHHHCFSVENYHKIIHHFNFTFKTKEPGSTDWRSMLYFAEVKEILKWKIYFCSPLEPYEDGHCYACKNQGLDDLKHPVIGAFDRGSPDTVFPYLWDSDSSDEFTPVRLEDEAEDERWLD
ncbi:uncharacterized protein LOC133904459 isoform X2 [Phragmites australis]|uniref:uncharacterized protein LOC133904459 isoform X2 n=1 Tax=Phragmites australis TaxID=29695 RepID=UPI002D78E581|nr:uncharacterized protein LOC133904459 isoform X2 [Phragmites australis]